MTDNALTEQERDWIVTFLTEREFLDDALVDISPYLERCLQLKDAFPRYLPNIGRLTKDYKLKMLKEILETDSLKKWIKELEALVSILESIKEENK